MALPKKAVPCPSCAGRGKVLKPDREAMVEKRKALGLSQSDLARAAGWQASVVSEMESGARPLTEAAAERYWNALRNGGKHEAEVKE